MPNKPRADFEKSGKKIVADSAREMRKNIEWFFRSPKLRDVNDYAELMEVFPLLTSKQKSMGIWLLGRLGGKKAVPLLLTLLDTEKTSMESICNSLILIGGDEIIQGLKRRLESEETEEGRLAIVHALSFLGFDKGIAEKLILLANNNRESAKIRAQAAEGLGYVLGGSNASSSLYKEAQQCLTSALSHLK